MNILLDGIQCVGKSTISRKLSRYFMAEMKDLPCHFVHYEGSKIDTADYNEQQYRDMFQLFVKGSGKRHFVVDRPHVGEVVWSKLYKSYDAETFIWDLERDFIKKFPSVAAETIQFFLFDEISNVLEREKLRKDNYSYTSDDRKQLFKTLGLYITAANKTSLNTRIIWIKNRTIDEVFDEIVKEIWRFA